MNLENKSIVITGASSGLGVAFSEALIAKGATVYGLARRRNKLDDLQNQLGDKFIGITCDVTDENAVIEAFNQINTQTDSIDGLVNNAGLGTFGPLEETSLETWNTLVNTNLTGVFLCSKAALLTMKKQGSGHVVNIASVAGLVGNANLTVYNTTKFGLRGFSEALMKEVRNDGIKVTCIYPGSIQTPFFDVLGVPTNDGMMKAVDVAESLIHVLEMPDNHLVSEVMMRPLRPALKL